MLKNRILEDLKKAVKDLGYPTTDIVVSIPKNSSFGDYSTNVALQLAKLKSNKTKQTPMEIANEIVEELKPFDGVHPERSRGTQDNLDEIKIAGGGFINFFIKDQTLVNSFQTLEILPAEKPLKILVEYGHTNPLKEVHIGHLRTFILGESLARILQSLGHTVFRANYQGDVGLHIAKAVWGIKNLGLPSERLSPAAKAEYMGQAYAEGNKAYEQDPSLKKQIDELNTKIYQKEAEVIKIYQLVRDWSLEYFDPIYALLGIKYDRCFFESEVSASGQEMVLANVGKVFKESEGAVIFEGKKYRLHNRVFITSAGHPTYEGKEIGLAKLEYAAFPYDQAIHIVAHEQAGYFQVVFKAIEMIFPYLKDKKYHLSYGLVGLTEGKMSSRTGSVITVDDLYKVVSEKVREVMKKGERGIDQAVVKKIAIGAIKFSYLKFSPAPNMVFDLEESVSLEGDSGPYIQYTYARIQSVLNKAKEVASPLEDSIEGELLFGRSGKLSISPEERSILQQLIYFQEIVEQAAVSFHPNLLASYLVELARSYNLFYQGSKIISSEKEEFRLKLSAKVGKVLQKGLYLLGIETAEKM